MPQTTITLSTRGSGLYEFTREAQAFVRESGREEGLLTVFVRHTSCSLLIQENADPDVKHDLDRFFKRLVPPSTDPSMRWIVFTADKVPRPRRVVAPSLSQGMSDADRPGTLAATLPATPLPSMCSQLGPA